MASNAVVAGPTAKRVGENVKRIRRARNLDQKDVSAILKSLGRPMLPTVLSKIERGERRVDVDDLVAIAEALNVSPAALLLPPTFGDDLVNLSEDHQVTSRTAWRWFQGLKTAEDWEPGEGVNPAEPGADPAIAAEAYERQEEHERRQAEYQAQTLPPALKRVIEHPALRLASQLADLVEQLVSPEAGADPSAAAARVRMALRRHQQLGIELEELQERFAPRPVVHPGVGFEQFRERLAAEGGIEDETAKDEPGGK
ncbi:helix-turn-helix transcriptional regulator [Streptomyces sp. RLB1-33]|nr:helix-turn-helix transcriptional regulator [Streptomyces sp. RLB1-33]QIY72066.1 helix-turn-helix transcriptional regulator [Streptomyces sp. RLB1-33]